MFGSSLEMESFEARAHPVRRNHQRQETEAKLEISRAFMDSPRMTQLPDVDPRRQSTLKVAAIPDFRCACGDLGDQPAAEFSAGMHADVTPPDDFLRQHVRHARP